MVFDQYHYGLFGFGYAIGWLGPVVSLPFAIVWAIVGLKSETGNPSLLQALLLLAALCLFSFIRFTCIAMNDWPWFSWQLSGWLYLLCALVLLIVSWVHYRQTRQVPQPRA